MRRQKRGFAATAVGVNERSATVSQRNSGYIRKEGDLYETPPWVTETLLGFISTRPGSILEPAAGAGQMVQC